MRHLCLLAVFCLLCPFVWAQTATEPDSGGTFSTPTYTPGPSIMPGAPGTAGGGGALPSFGRGSAGGNPAFGTSPSTRQQGNGQGRTLDPNELLTLRRMLEPLPPPKPSEFQKFVDQATGRMLPVFGTNFFLDPLTAQGLLDNVPVSADYVIGPGDELVIRAWGSIDVDYRATVDRNGQINLPKVGSFNVAGIKAADIERHLRAQIGRVYTNFNLNVTLGLLRGLKVFVVGPAQRPGTYT